MGRCRHHTTPPRFDWTALLHAHVRQSMRCAYALRDTPLFESNPSRSRCWQILSSSVKRSTQAKAKPSRFARVNFHHTLGSILGARDIAPILASSWPSNFLPLLHQPACVGLSTFLPAWPSKARLEAISGGRNCDPWLTREDFNLSRRNRLPRMNGCNSLESSKSSLMPLNCIAIDDNTFQTYTST